MAIEKPPQSVVPTAVYSRNLCSAKGRNVCRNGYWVGLFDAITVTGVSR
jgi:hypothetical protein